MSRQYQSATRRTPLRLSEGTRPDRTFGTLWERFEDLLELHERARALGHHGLAEWYANRIVDEMLGGAA